MPAAKDKKAKSESSSGLITFYLIAYNAIQFLGWTAIFIQTVSYIISKRTYVGLWDSTHLMLKIFQTAAILEIVHSAIGFVKSNPMMALFQIFSRVLVVWGIAHSVEASQNVLGIPLLLFTWTITEMVRYSFYFLNLVSFLPQFLVWSRYTFFYVLYPMGVTGELLCMYAALPFIRDTQLYSLALPNRLNISFNYYYTIILIMIGYIPIFPQLYFHMIGQRKKVLGPKKD